MPCTVGGNLIVAYNKTAVEGKGRPGDEKSHCDPKIIKTCTDF